MRTGECKLIAMYIYNEVSIPLCLRKPLYMTHYQYAQYSCMISELYVTIFHSSACR